MLADVRIRLELVMVVNVRPERYISTWSLGEANCTVNSPYEMKRAVDWVAAMVV